MSVSCAHDAARRRRGRPRPGRSPPATCAVPDGPRCPRSASSDRRDPSTATTPPTRPCSCPAWCAHAPMRIAETLRAHLGSPPACWPTERRAARLPEHAARPGLGSGRRSPRIRAGRAELRRRARSTHPHRINVEFVSANPTGPLTVGNARGAFVGDLLCRVLEAVGHQVTREYYFNDFNAQVRNLGLSLLAPPRGPRVPEDGYHGEYVAEPRGRAAGRASGPPPTGRRGRRRARCSAAGRPSAIRAGIEASLAALGVRFDVWTSEGSLHDEGWVERAIDQLREARPHLRAGRRHLVPLHRVRRRQGSGRLSAPTAQPTYFASRHRLPGREVQPRLRRARSTSGARTTTAPSPATRPPPQALGFDAEPSSACSWPGCASCATAQDIGMSKRAGEFITLDELLAEIGPDAARWFFGSRAPGTGIDFDIELANARATRTRSTTSSTPMPARLASCATRRPRPWRPTTPSRPRCSIIRPSRR